jgi:hypothetical protein
MDIHIASQPDKETAGQTKRGIDDQMNQTDRLMNGQTEEQADLTAVSF